MSIRSLRDQGMKDITMRYEEGGKVQVFVMGDKEVRFDRPASVEEIKAAFEEKK
jgi:hypothetical protein